MEKKTYLICGLNLLLFFTGFSRNSSLILNEQDKKTKKNEKDIIKNLDYIKYHLEYNDKILHLLQETLLYLPLQSLLMSLGSP